LAPKTIELIVKHCHESNIKGMLHPCDETLHPFLITQIFQLSCKCSCTTLATVLLIINSEPTSVAKAGRILPAISSTFAQASCQKPPINLVTPNILELTRLYQVISSEPYELTSHDKWWSTIDKMSLNSEFRMGLEHLARRDASEDGSCGTLSFITENGIAQMGINLLPFFQHIVLKCGNRGVLVIFRSNPNGSAWTQEGTNLKERQLVAAGKDGSAVVIKHYPAMALPQDDIINVTGAGDSLVGSLLASLVLNPKAFEDSPLTLDAIIRRAQTVRQSPSDAIEIDIDRDKQAAVMTLKSPHAVSPSLSNLRDE
jgi:pseudouridylate synthase / pseudouridine kinase